jgi:cytochrome c553
VKLIGMLLVAILLLAAESFADAKAGERKAQLCLLCHKAANATPIMAAVPLLEAQPAKYLYLQTKAYKDKRRLEPVMQANTANLSEQDMRDIADYLAAQKPVRVSYQLDPAKISTGQAKAEELKCATCHGATFQGTGEIPRLAGQAPAYLQTQLEGFGSGKRRHGMGQQSAPPAALSEQDMESLAQFFASLQ